MNGNANLNANNLTPSNVVDWRKKLGIGRTQTNIVYASSNANITRYNGDYQRPSADFRLEITTSGGDILVFSSVRIRCNATTYQTRFLLMQEDGTEIATPTKTHNNTSLQEDTILWVFKDVPKGTHIIDFQAKIQNTANYYNLQQYNTSYIMAVEL